jgi:hypothetical protein
MASRSLRRVLRASGGRDSKYSRTRARAGVLRWRSQTPRPWADAVEARKIVGAPRIRGEARDDFLRRAGAYDEENVGRSLQPTTEDDEPLPLQSVHERRARFPTFLTLEGPGADPRRAATSNHGEEAPLRALIRRHAVCPGEISAPTGACVDPLSRSVAFGIGAGTYRNAAEDENHHAIARAPSCEPSRNLVDCEVVTPRSPSLGVALGAVAAWAVLVTVLHVAINGRGSLVPGSAVPSLQVGGLPVT